MLLKFPFLLSELFGWEFCPSQAGCSLSSAMSGTTNPVSLTSQSVAMATPERHAVNGLVFSAETIKERWRNHREHTYMTCTHTNVCKKKRTREECKSWKPKIYLGFVFKAWAWSRGKFFLCASKIPRSWPCAGPGQRYFLQSAHCQGFLFMDIKLVVGLVWGCCHSLHFHAFPKVG